MAVGPGDDFECVGRPGARSIGKRQSRRGTVNPREDPILRARRDREHSDDLRPTAGASVCIARRDSGAVEGGERHHVVYRLRRQGTVANTPGSSVPFSAIVADRVGACMLARAGWLVCSVDWGGPALSFPAGWVAVVRRNTGSGNRVSAGGQPVNGRSLPLHSFHRTLRGHRILFFGFCDRMAHRARGDCCGVRNRTFVLWIFDRASNQSMARQYDLV